MCGSAGLGTHRAVSVLKLRYAEEIGRILPSIGSKDVELYEAGGRFALLEPAVI